MTKKDFELIARVVRTITCRETRAAVCGAFSKLLEQDNPSFDRLRFAEACDALKDKRAAARLYGEA